ncbi:MAG TPA: helix-turn-helix domain-containing protein [Terriglobales bacterium]
MPSKKYLLKLSVEERQILEKVITEPRVPGWKILRARALLKCDQGSHGPAWSDARIAEALECTVNSLENWRKQAVLQGPLSLLERKPYQPWKEPKLDGEKEARLTALACSPAPDGHARWTLRLLAEHLVKLDVVDSISHETVRQVLKKTNCSRGGKRCGVSRPSKTRRLSRTWSKC